MGRTTLSNSEEVEPATLLCFDIRPEECSDVADLFSCNKLKLRTAESKGPILEIYCVPEDDCVDEHDGNAESSTSKNKEEQPKPLRKRKLQQRKETAQTGKRGDYHCTVPWSGKFGIILLVGLLFGSCIAGVDGAQPHCGNVTRTVEQNVGELVKVRLASPSNCHLDFFDRVTGRYKIICYVTECDSSLGYTMDEEGYLRFTASNKTAGCYKLIEFGGNKVVDTILLTLLPKDPLKARLETPKLDPPESGATLDMPSELLMAVVFTVLGFLICRF